MGDVRQPGPVNFHAESIRKSGVVLTLIAPLACGIAWSMSDHPISRGLVLFLGCILLYFGLRLLLAPKLYRTWFDNGRVFWEFPSRLQGVDGSCAIADIACLHCTKVGFNKETPAMLVFHLIEKDGSKKEIGWRCMGDVNRFYTRLREENPDIAYTEGDK